MESGCGLGPCKEEGWQQRWRQSWSSAAQCPGTKLQRELPIGALPSPWACTHLHDRRQLRVSQLPLAGVAPREDLAVCRQRHGVRAARRHRHDALVADGFHQHEQPLVVEVAVAQLAVASAPARPQLPRL